MRISKSIPFARLDEGGANVSAFLLGGSSDAISGNCMIVSINRKSRGQSKVSLMFNVHININKIQNVKSESGKRRAKCVIVGTVAFVLRATAHRLKVLSRLARLSSSKSIYL